MFWGIACSEETHIPGTGRVVGKACSGEKHVVYDGSVNSYHGGLVTRTQVNLSQVEPELSHGRKPFLQTWAVQQELFSQNGNGTYALQKNHSQLLGYGRGPCAEDKSEPSLCCMRRGQI